MSYKVYKHKNGRFFVTGDSPHWGEISVNIYKTGKLKTDYGLEVPPRTTYEYATCNCTLICELKDIEANFDKLGYDNMKKLYEFENNGTTLYGTHMATNGDGLWVMDVKGAQPVAVSKDSVKEVVPHSIRVKIEGKVDHLQAEKDKYEVGQVFITAEGKIAFVEKVNTETRTPKEFKPVARLATVAI